MLSDLVPLHKLDEQDVEAWRDLARRSLEPNPFFEPEFVLPAAAALKRTDIQLLRIRDRDGLLLCFPALRTRWWRRSPLVALVAWRHLYSFLGTPLVDRDRAREALSALLDFVDTERGIAFMALELLAGEGEVASVLRTLASERGSSPLEPLRFERAALYRRPEEDYVEVSAKHRREWQRQRRRLTERLDAEPETRDRSGDEGAVGDFLELEASGWKGRAGTAFASLPGHADLFREICRGFHAGGRLQLLALEAGERPVALKCNLLAGDGMFCFKIAFDDSLSEYSPGMQLELDNIPFFHHQTTVAWMDSCAGRKNQMINRLWPDRRSIAALVVPAAGLRGRGAARGIELAATLRSRGGS